MPRSEARIFTSIWRDPAYVCMPADAQWLYEFLLSQDDLTYCGVLPLRPSRWCKKAADMTTGRIGDALKWLEGTAKGSPNPNSDSAPTPLVVADAETGELLVRSLMRRDGIWKMPNIFKLAIEAAAQVESPRILGALLAEAQRFPLDETGSDLVRTLVEDFIANLEKGSPYPTPYPSPDPSDNPTDEGSGNPTAKGHARARGSGDPLLTPGRFPEPLIPVPQDLTSLSRKNGTRLPDDFAVTEAMREWAAEHTPHVAAERELARFCDYWRSKPGKDGRKLDWPATWRNWMRTAEDRQGPRERPPPGPSRKAEADALRARIARENP